MTDSKVAVGASVQLALPGFDGPVDALLRLVAQQKLPVEEISVASVAEQCFLHVRRSPAIDLDVAGDLIAASARLMAMKSTRLLAEPESEADEEEPLAPTTAPERETFARIAQRLREEEGVESVPPLAPATGVERRREPWAPELLGRAWADMQRRITVPGRRLAVPAFVRLEVAVSRLIRQLHAGATLAFRHMVAGSSRQDTVVHFLAVLELVRRRQIVARQDDTCGEIVLEWKADGAESSTRAG